MPSGYTKMSEAHNWQARDPGSESKLTTPQEVNSATGKRGAELWNCARLLYLRSRYWMAKVNRRCSLGI